MGTQYSDQLIHKLLIWQIHKLWITWATGTQRKPIFNWKIEIEQDHVIGSCDKRKMILINKSNFII